MNVSIDFVKVIFVALTITLPYRVAAEESLMMTDPVASTGKVVFFLLLTLAIIIFMAWLVAKTRGAQLGQTHNAIKTVAVLPMGIKEKIAVIQIGDKNMVVGITPHSIQYLTELDQPLEHHNPDNSPLKFSDFLKKSLQK